MEVGYAAALGVPVFASTRPSDRSLGPHVQVVASVEAALGDVRNHTLDVDGIFDPLQRYYSRVSEQRGYSSETPQDAMLLLTEEVGELARAVRKSLGLARSSGYAKESIAEELADVQLYLVHLANISDIRLGEAVTHKEFINATREATKILTKSA
jgi:NTP pyrophosphatase (non-canonical NTP hydrolase)